MPDDQERIEPAGPDMNHLRAPGSRGQWFRQQQARTGMLQRGRPTAQALRRPQPEPEE
jgi:hypothetical protein